MTRAAVQDRQARRPCPSPARLSLLEGRSNKLSPTPPRSNNQQIASPGTSTSALRLRVSARERKSLGLHSTSLSTSLPLCYLLHRSKSSMESRTFWLNSPTSTTPHSSVNHAPFPTLVDPFAPLLVAPFTMPEVRDRTQTMLHLRTLLQNCLLFEGMVADLHHRLS
jgi:hypothetical protein